MGKFYEGLIYFLHDLIVSIRSYSPGIYLFQFGSALNPDSSICMNRRCSPWLLAVVGFVMLCRGFHPVLLELCHQLCNHVDTFFVLPRAVLRSIW